MDRNGHGGMDGFEAGALGRAVILFVDDIQGCSGLFHLSHSQSVWVGSAKRSGEREEFHCMITQDFSFLTA